MDAQLLEDVKSCLETGRLQLLIGWCRGNLVDMDGNVCALGALSYGKGKTLLVHDRVETARNDYKVVETAAGVLVRNLPAEFLATRGYKTYSQYTVAEFNNTRETVGPVIDLFDRAIQDVKQQIADAA